MILPIAQATSSGPAGLLGSPIILIVGMFLVLYITMIRPQARQAKAHRALIEGLKKGDRIVTAGGIHGTVTKIDETTVVISVEDGTRIRIERSRVAVVTTKDASTKEVAEETAA